MKILNSLGTKCVLFSLCCFLVLSAFTATEKPVEIINNIESTNMEMAIGFELKSETEKRAFFESMTYEDTKELEANYAVKEYLASIGKLEAVTCSMKDGSQYSELNLSNHLNKTELAEFKTFKPAATDIACSYTVYCGPFAWCSTPYVHVFRNCNGSYSSWCAYSCSYF